MKLYQFPEWKQQALSYWSNVLDNSVNKFYEKMVLLNDPTSGQANYDNKVELLNFININLTNIEGLYTTYKTDSTILDKTKDSLISLMSYISMKDIITTKTGPQIPNILSNMEDWYKMFSYDLPDFSTLYTITPTRVIGTTAVTNGELKNQRLWYDMNEPYPMNPLPFITPPSTATEVYTFVTANASIVSNSISALNVSFSTFPSYDINNMNVFASLIFSNSKDAIIYRMFGEPELKSSNKKAKQIILENYKFSNVLSKFNWTIQGLN